MDVILTLWLDSSLKTAARVAAARNDISMSEWVRQTIEEKLTKEHLYFFGDDASDHLHRESARAEQS